MNKPIKILIIILCAVLGVAIVLSVAIGAASLLSGIFRVSGVSDTFTDYPISDDVIELTVDIEGANVTVSEGDSFFVKSNLKYLNVFVTDGHLVIKDNGNRHNDFSGAVLDITIPKNTELKYLYIDAGAANVNAERICAQRLQLDMGAGNVVINDLSVSYDCDVSGSTGSLNIKNGIINNADIEMGVGNLNITASLLGRSRFDLGVGSTDLVLIGSENDYSINFEGGISSASVNGEDIADGQVWGKGSNRIDVSGGVGAVDITFKD